MMFARKKIFLAGAMLSSCWMLTLGALAAGVSDGWVTTRNDPLAVRASASTSAKQLGSLPRGSHVSLLYRTGDWWYVEYAKGRQGYCHADYITEASGQPEGAILLEVPDYKQTDSRWASTLIGQSGQTMGRIGCTTAALADVESHRTGTQITPPKMEARLSYTAGGAVYWPEHYKSDSSPDYLSMILHKLREGKPTIVGAKNSSGKAHWVVVTGYRGKGTPKAADFMINDPGSKSRTSLSQLFAEYPHFYKLMSY